jgi:hypothetical protein
VQQFLDIGGFLIEHPGLHRLEQTHKNKFATKDCDACFRFPNTFDA